MAFIAAQSEIEGAAKDKLNPHFKNAYADLKSIWDACKPALAKNGIGVVQSPCKCDVAGAMALETTLLHKSGEWMRSLAVVPLQKADPQGYGSALTYARRYSLAAMVGVCPEDDDGEGAVGRGKQAARPQQRPAQRPPANGDDLSDSSNFRMALHAAFKSRGFTPDGEKAAVGKALDSFQRDRIEDMDLNQRHMLIADVVQGKADKLKSVNGVEAALA